MLIFQMYAKLKQFLNLKHKKIQVGFNKIPTHDLCDTGAVVYQVSYQAKLELTN